MCDGLEGVGVSDVVVVVLMLGESRSLWRSNSGELLLLELVLGAPDEFFLERKERRSLSIWDWQVLSKTVQLNRRREIYYICW